MDYKKEQFYILHKCDNRPCSNPKHLFRGNHKDNMLDMARKGRTKNSKLNIADVKKINSTLSYLDELVEYVVISCKNPDLFDSINQTVSFYHGMTVHAGLSRRDISFLRIFDRCVAIPAIHPQFTGMKTMTERHWLHRTISYISKFG